MNFWTKKTKIIFISVIAMLIMLFSLSFVEDSKCNKFSSSDGGFGNLNAKSNRLICEEHSCVVRTKKETYGLFEGSSFRCTGKIFGLFYREPKFTTEDAELFFK